MSDQPAVQIAPPETPAICDYEGSGYQADFWDGKGRDYEDAVERTALRRLLPAWGERYVEFGAGFGRLADMADAYGQVVLVDYSRSLLEQARDKWGDRDRFVYVAADLNRLPFVPNAFDTAVMVRVLHHLPDPLHVLQQIRSTLTPQATFILEFANKLNLKAIARYITGMQDWNPFDQSAVEFVKLNYDFHPAAVRDMLDTAGFLTLRTLAVSWLRIGALKRRIPIDLLKGIDSALQPLGAALPFAPSIFMRNQTKNDVNTPRASLVPLESLFVNPNRRESILRREGDTLICPQTDARWAIRDGIYDFKAPL